jgi:hypothetical protein
MRVSSLRRLETAPSLLIAADTGRVMQHNASPHKEITHRTGPYTLNNQRHKIVFRRSLVLLPELSAKIQLNKRNKTPINHRSPTTVTAHLSLLFPSVLYMALPHDHPVLFQGLLANQLVQMDPDSHFLLCWRLIHPTPSAPPCLVRTAGCPSLGPVTLYPIQLALIQPMNQ